jgi:uncharacterized protein YndB with AHSA1/START domain
MIRVDASVEIERPPGEVFAYLARIEHLRDWLPGIDVAERTSPEPVGPGTRFRLASATPAGRLELRGEVTELVPERLLAVRAGSSQAVVAGRCELVPQGAGTRLSVRTEVELKGWLRFAEGTVAGNLRTGLPAALARLRAKLEAAGDPGASLPSGGPRSSDGSGGGGGAGGSLG